MKQVAITDPKADLETLVREVEATGEDIVLTRDGRPAARLKAEAAVLTPEQIRALILDMIARRDARQEPVDDPDFDWRAAIDEGSE